MVFLLTRLQTAWLLRAPRPPVLESLQRAHMEISLAASQNSVVVEIEQALSTHRLRVIRITDDAFDNASGIYRMLRYSEVLQYLSLIRIQALPAPEGCIVRIISCSISALPSWFPLSFLATWIPFPDFGYNEAVVMSIIKLLSKEARSFRSVADGGSCYEVKMIERGSLKFHSVQALISCVSPQTRFFFAFILIPVISLVYALYASGVVKS